jgi:hypothetical protein
LAKRAFDIFHALAYRFILCFCHWSIGLVF